MTLEKAKVVIGKVRDESSRRWAGSNVKELLDVVMLFVLMWLSDCPMNRIDAAVEGVTKFGSSSGLIT